MSTVLTSTERHRPGSMRDSVRRLFARALTPRQRDSRPAGIFAHAQNTTVQNANFTINQYGALTMEHPLPSAVTLAEGHIGGGSIPASSRLPEHDVYPRPRRESPDVYVDCLLTKNRGYPLWIPSPNRTLPIFNRTLGVSVGDVGVLTPDGGFDFLFSIFHDAAHPINAVVGVPDAFTPFSPAPAPADIQEFIEWNAGTFLADASIVKVPNDGDQSIVLEATGAEGAVLMIPEDIYTTRLKITDRLRKYVAQNIVGWYRFVKYTLGHDIENGDLRVVYGCRKSSGFGIATAFNTGRQENTRLSFSVEGSWAEISRCPYRWSHTGSAEVKTGPSGVDNVECLLTEPVKNQCLFVNTIDPKISAETWRMLELSTMEQVTPESTTGEANSVKDRSVAKSSESQLATGSCSAPCHQRAFHPSVILQDILETINPGLPAYIVCDDDWAPFVVGNLPDARDFVDQILEKRIIVEDQGILFLCAKNNINLLQEPGQSCAAYIRFRRINAIEGSSNNSCSRWQAERSINASSERDPIGAVLDLAFTETAHWPTSEANDNKGANTGDNANNQDNDASLQSSDSSLSAIPAVSQAYKNDFYPPPPTHDVTNQEKTHYRVASNTNLIDDRKDATINRPHSVPHEQSKKNSKTKDSIEENTSVSLPNNTNEIDKEFNQSSKGFLKRGLGRIASKFGHSFHEHIDPSSLLEPALSATFAGALSMTPAFSVAHKEEYHPLPGPPQEAQQAEEARYRAPVDLRTSRSQALPQHSRLPGTDRKKDDNKKQKKDTDKSKGVEVDPSKHRI